MYLQEIVEVAIGMVFVWFLVSLCVMTVQEWISAKLKWRANDLETAMRRMLDDPHFDPKVQAGLEGQPFYKAFMENPLIKSLSKPGEKPSYISASKFASVVLDTVLTAGTKDSTIQRELNRLETEINTLQTKQPDAKALFDEIKGLIGSVSQTDVVKKAFEAKKKEFEKKFPEFRSSIELLQLPDPSQNLGETLNNLSRGAAIVAVKDPKINEALNNMVGNVKAYAKNEEAALANARTNLENYFNDYMDRLAGVYKRRAQVWAFFIALAIALLLNIDSYNLIQHLWREPTLRQTIVAQAQEAVKKDSTTENIDVPGLQDKMRNLNIPIGWARVSNSDMCYLFPSQPKEGEKVSLEARQVFCLFGRIRPANLSDANSTSLLTWLLGIVITAGAATQGSPFWFDILGKLVNVRSAGIKPEEKDKKSAQAEK